MLRLFLIFLAAVIAVWLIRRAIAGPRARGGGPAPEAKAAGGDLVACAHCGMNLPKAEARGAEAGWYCSEEHQRAGPKGH